jgi:hypothetical protein
MTWMPKKRARSKKGSKWERALQKARAAERSAPPADALVDHEKDVLSRKLPDCDGVPDEFLQLAVELRRLHGLERFVGDGDDKIALELQRLYIDWRAEARSDGYEAALQDCIRRVEENPYTSRPQGRRIAEGLMTLPPPDGGAAEERPPAIGAPQ